MQFVVFKLADEHFAVETDRVQGINDMMSVTRVPKAPNYIKGLINLRGSIKSLVDINLLLKIEPVREPQNIIILKVNDEEVGISVDEVEEVIDIDDNTIQRLKEHSNEEYVKGVIQLNDNLLTVIEIEKLLNR